MNLEKILNDVVTEFGKNENYFIPTISWSEENMIGRFGEYQYWRNHIVISRLLNTSEISERALESVIFHEYTHQLWSDHTKEFNKRMKLFTGYEECYQELDDYLNSIENPGEGICQGIQLRNDTDTLVLRILMDENEEDSYWTNMEYFDHCMVGTLAMNIPSKFAGKHNQVLFVVDVNNQTYIVGFAKNVIVHPKQYTCDMCKYGYEAVTYNFKYKRDEGELFLPMGCLPLGDTFDMPESYQKIGVCYLAELGTPDGSNVIKSINQYNFDLHELGLKDAAIGAVPGIEMEEIRSLISMANKETSYMRKIWIMNKAVSITQSYSAYIERAKSLEANSLYDVAMSDIAKALSFPEDGISKITVKEAIRMFQNCAEAHQKFGADMQ